MELLERFLNFKMLLQKRGQLLPSPRQFAQVPSLRYCDVLPADIYGRGSRWAGRARRWPSALRFMRGALGTLLHSVHGKWSQDGDSPEVWTKRANNSSHGESRKNQTMMMISASQKVPARPCRNPLDAAPVAPHTSGESG